MFDEKIKIENLIIKNVKFDFNDIEIIVAPYFTADERASYIKNYIENLYGDLTLDLSSRYIKAKYGLILQILDGKTNVDITSGYDYIVNSGLWGEILSRIPCYEEFRKDLDKVLAIIESEKSIGSAVDKFLSNATNVVNKISNLDAKKLKEVADQFSSEINKLNEKVPGIAGKPVKRKYIKKVNNE